MRQFFLCLFFCIAMLMSDSAHAWSLFSKTQAPSIPTAANSMCSAMDAQLQRRFKREDYKSQIQLVSTVAVNLVNMNVTNAVSMQMSEEMTRWFTNAGYGVEELRKTSDIQINPRAGETMLSRDMKLLANRNGAANLILVGTYTRTDYTLRFNMKLLRAVNNEVLAMASATVPITPELQPLLNEGGSLNDKMYPSVETRLP